MALKFRRGTTAQQSGSLAYGEPYVNTTLGTLLVGGPTGDIVLSTSGTGSTGNFGAISGSGLDITGNANIAGNLTLGGNITIGDAGTDNLVINADLSSSLIPNNDNAFTIGTSALRYSNIYGVNIIGSIGATNGVVSGSSQIVSILSSLNTYTGSNDTTNTAQNSRLTNLESATASLFIDTVNLEAFSASQLVKDSTLATYTASLETKNATLATYTASLETKNTTLATYTASLETKNATLAAYTASNDTKWSTLGSLSGSFARTNSTNTFTGTQIISGSLFVTQDLVVQGSSSIQTISSSRLDIGDNIIQLNVNSPSLRFGGLAINDSGSAGGSGSFLYDSVDDEWVFVHKGNGTNVTSSHVVMGPETYDNLGNEIYMTSNRIPKVTNYEHLGDSNISDNGSVVSINSSTQVTGSLEVSTAITASAGKMNGTLTLSGDLPRLYLTDTVHNDDYSIINSDGTFTIYDDTKSLGVFKIYTTGLTEVNGGLSVTNGVTASIAALNGVVSGSSQVDHNATTNYVANKHIDHTSVQISAGNGLSGGGDISSTRTLALDTTSATFTTGVKSKLDTDAVVSGSKTITIAGQSTSLGGTVTAETIRTAIGTVVTGSSQIVGSSITTNTITIGSTSTALGGTSTSLAGLSSVTSTGFTGALTGNASTATTLQTARTINGTSFNGSADITIANLVSGSGQVAIASTTGFGTYINQALLTTSAVTHGNLTINGTITATGDITAYFTSDIRHKNNVELIDNALEKVNALNGVTWDWADDVDEVTKQTPTTGLIAQDVLDVLPEVVKTRENGFLALDYSKMVGLLVEAIKEQDIVIQKLKADMVQLNSTITVFEDRMKEKGLL